MPEFWISPEPLIASVVLGGIMSTCSADKLAVPVIVQVEVDGSHCHPRVWAIEAFSTKFVVGFAAADETANDEESKSTIANEVMNNKRGNLAILFFIFPIPLLLV